MKRLLISIAVLLCVVFFTCTFVSADIIAEGNCGPTAEWRIDDAGNLRISGSGKVDSHPWWTDMEVYYLWWIPIYDYNITSVTIEDGITEICDFAFYYAQDITFVDLGKTIQKIGTYAFNNIGSVNEVRIPMSTTYIGGGSFGESDIKALYVYSSDCEIIDYGIMSSGIISIGSHNYRGKIYGIEGSTAEEYAKEFGLEFEVTDIPYEYRNYFPYQITYNGAVYDLLTQPINILKDSNVEVEIKINYEKYTGVEDIYLTQDAVSAVALENNVGQKIIPSQIFSPSYEKVDEEGEERATSNDIYVLIVNRETGESVSKKTKLKIVDDLTSITDLEFKFGKEIGFTIPESVPVFGDTEIKWDFDFIPISIEKSISDDTKYNIVLGSDIAKSDGEKNEFVDFDFEEYKSEIKKAASKQGRTLKQLKNDFKMSNAHKMNLYGGKIVGGGTGTPSFDIDVAGYAEMKNVNGIPRFIEGQIVVEAQVEYTYQGQIFLGTVPCYYEIGGGVGAGFEGQMVNIDPITFNPEFEAYLTTRVSAKIGAGIGIAKVMTFGPRGNGSLNLKTSLNDRYVKAWGEGSADFNLKIFGQDVATKTFAKGAFLIYETGNSSGLIPDSAVTIGSSGGGGSGGGGGRSLSLFSDIDVNSVYKNESRAYAEKPTVWYTDTQEVSLFGSASSNKNPQISASNVYTEATPMLHEINGKTVEVMLSDNSSRDDINRTMLVYRVKEENGAWTKPTAILDDGTADYYPCFNNGYVAWQNQNSLLNDNMDLKDIAEKGEIYVAKWNGTGFDSPVRVTNNSILDTIPYVCSDGINASVVWVENDDNNILGLTGNNRIMYSHIIENVCTTPVVAASGLNAVISLSAGYIDGELVIAFSEDGDNNYQTIDDRDVFTITAQTIKNVTSNSVLDSNPIIINNYLYYFCGSNIVRILLKSATGLNLMEDIEPEYVFDTAIPGLTDNFSVSSNSSGDTVILYSKPVSESSGLFAAINTDGKWSNEILLSEINNQLRYPNGYISDNGDITLSFSSLAYDDDGGTQNDLYTLNFTPSYDLELVDVYVDEKAMMAYVTIKNSGELEVGSYSVKLLYNGTAITSADNNGVALKAGETAEYKLNYNAGNGFTKRSFEVAVIADGIDEYNTENNTADVIVGNCDIEITQVDSFERLPESEVAVILANIGYDDTGKTTVFLRENSTDGKIVGTKTIDNIKPGGQEYITFTYEITSNDSARWCITASTENADASVANNNKYFINDHATTANEYELSIGGISVTKNCLTVNAYCENNTADLLDAVSFATIYDIKGNTKSVLYEKISIPAYESYSGNFKFPSYKYECGDRIKVMLLDGFNSMKPLCDYSEGELDTLNYTVLDSGILNNTILWKIDGFGRLFIEGTGALNTYSPWGKHKNLISAIIVGDNITEIGATVFSLNITCDYIQIGKSVSIIHEDAFRIIHFKKFIVSTENPYYYNDDAGALISTTSKTLLHYPVGVCGNYSIPQGIYSLSQYAFNYSSVEKVTIPKSVKNISSTSFDETRYLSFIEVDAKNSNFINDQTGTLYSTEGMRVDEQMGEVYFADQILIKHPTNCKKNEYEILDGTNIIGEYAFSYNTDLTSITIPNSVIEIKHHAFYSSPNITDIYYEGTAAEWANNVTIAGGNSSILDANIHCSDSDTEVITGKCGLDLIYYIADNTLTITGSGIMDSALVANAPWRDSETITTLVVKEGVTGFATRAFYNMAALEKVTLPSSLKIIDNGAFMACRKLSDIVIPANVQSIGQAAFACCNSMTSYVVDKNNKYFKTDSAGALYDTDMTTLYAYPCANTSSSYTVPEGVTTVLKSAFTDCNNLNEVVMPSTLKTLGVEAFSYCMNLKKVTLNQGITTIDSSAFAYCISLDNVVLPSSLTQISTSAFKYCAALCNITIPSTITSIADSAFETCDNLKNVYYTGTQTQWGKISVGSNNTALTNATITYNYK